FAVLSGIMSGGGGGRGGRGGGGGAEGRLTKALVDNKLATSASMRFEQLHDPGLVEFSANLTNDQSLDAAKQAIYKVIAGIISEPPTKDEVERVKTGMLRNLENQLSDAQTLGVNG